MIRLTHSLAHWLFTNHPNKVSLIAFGHLELFTPEMQQAYLEWVQTEEGMQYLKGGSKYRPELN